MSVKYWEWPEIEWVSKEIVCNKAMMITAGVDVGSVSSKAAIMCDGELYACGVVRTGADSKASALKAMDKALKIAGLNMEDIRYSLSTGYGRENVPFAGKTLTDIVCHARGARYMYGATVRTILDIGGLGTKAISCDRNGNVTAFVMNDKCAAAPGLGIEMFAEMVGVPVTEIGGLSLEIDEEPEPVSSTCVTYANSMALENMSRGTPKNKVLAGHHFSIAWRDKILLERLAYQSGNGIVEKDLAITGGVAKNMGIVKRIEREIGLELLIGKGDPQIAGAVGAGLFAAELAAKVGN
jgi:bzd-type benzoyl-CoA reductase Q subunit